MLSVLQAYVKETQVFALFVPFSQGMIEQRTNEILQSYASFTRRAPGQLGGVSMSEVAVNR
jgi:hypothetical protein